MFGKLIGVVKDVAGSVKNTAYNTYTDVSTKIKPVASLS